MVSFPQPQYFFAAVQENKDLRPPCVGFSSLLTNIYILKINKKTFVSCKRVSLKGDG